MTTTAAPETLTRLVVDAPGRRLDLVLPGQLPVAYLLPAVLRRAGAALADDAQAHQGWLLRRLDGTPVDAETSLSDQLIRDGERLHLVPRRLEWPEPAYDDVVEAISAGARRRGPQWAPAATRVSGLLAMGLALLVGLATAAFAGPPWPATAALTLAAAGLLLVVGTVLSRAFSDAPAGATVAATAMPYAFVGGLLLLADEALWQVGAPQLLAGSALLAAAGLTGHLGTAAYGRLFVTGVTAGGCGTVGAGAALLAGQLGAAGAAALVVTLVLLFSPLIPAVAVRVGRLPLPELPRTPADLVDDAPAPERRSVEAATSRTDEVLTGALLGTTVAGAACFGLLASAGQPTALVLVVVVASAFLLRARFHAAVRHRVPLLVAGGAGLALATASWGVVAGADQIGLSLPVTVAAALAALAAGLVYRRRAASPRLGRYADVLDVLLTLAVVPLAADVAGLYGYVRGLGG